jgi:uncharacterized cysteine cluster protein YcgN (CxxCxxCC family)
MKFLDKHEAYLKYFVDEFRKRRGLKLKGSCFCCGSCCDGKIRVFHMNTETMTVDLIKRKEEVCPHYNTETKKCNMYNDDRPILCQLFPYVPENLYPNCGYYFEKE